MGNPFRESKENKEAKKAWRNRPEEEESLTDKAKRHHTENNGDFLHYRSRVPKLVKDPTVCALCKSPMNRYGFCSNRECKYGN